MNDNLVINIFKNFLILGSKGKMFLIFVFLFIIEIIPIMIGALESINLENRNTKIFLGLFYNLNYCSTYHYIKEKLVCDQTSGIKLCYIYDIIFLDFLIVFCSFLTISFLILKNKYFLSNNRSSFVIFFILFLIRIWEILFHTVNINIFFILINKIFHFRSYAVFNNNTIYILYSWGVLIIMFIFISLNCIFIYMNNIYISLDSSITSCRDIFFSKLYDYFLLILKVLICIHDNIVLYNYEKFC